MPCSQARAELEVVDKVRHCWMLMLMLILMQVPLLLRLLLLCSCSGCKFSYCSRNEQCICILQQYTLYCTDYVCTARSDSTLVSRKTLTTLLFRYLLRMATEKPRLIYEVNPSSPTCEQADFVAPCNARGRLRRQLEYSAVACFVCPTKQSSAYSARVYRTVFFGGMALSK